MLCRYHVLSIRRDSESVATGGSRVGYLTDACVFSCQTRRSSPLKLVVRPDRRGLLLLSVDLLVPIFALDDYLEILIIG